MRLNGGVSTPATQEPSPFLTFGRNEWAALADSTPLPLTESDIDRLRGLGDPIDLAEVDRVYRPLSRLLDLYSSAIGSLHSASTEFLGETTRRTPFIIGIAGSVAVGKSTTARLLKTLLSRWPRTPRVELITTDGFLLPNEELARRGIMDRKGFPESYDRRALRRFIATIKSGADQATAPVYSHLTYDIVPGETQVVQRPDILIVEGLNVLQPAAPRDATALAVSDYFDMSIYVDAAATDVKKWYIDRFLAFRSGAFANPDSYFHAYSQLTDEQAIARASQIWDSINLPNLVQNIRPTRSRATIILRKGSDHRIERVMLRKL